MTLTLVEMWILFAEAIGMLVIERKLLIFYVPIVMLTIVLFFFFPR